MLPKQTDGESVTDYQRGRPIKKYAILPLVSVPSMLVRYPLLISPHLTFSSPASLLTSTVYSI